VDFKRTRQGITTDARALSARQALVRYNSAERNRQYEQVVSGITILNLPSNNLVPAARNFAVVFDRNQRSVFGQRI
jgi:hypothetical protein